MLETGWKVVNFDKLTYAGDAQFSAQFKTDPRYKFFVSDIADTHDVEEVFAAVKPDVVVNFAAESHVDRSILDAAPFITTNVTGVQVLLDACRRHKVERFLQVSTDEVYGDVEGKSASDEGAPLNPSSPYAASKAAADLLVLAYRRTYGLPVAIVRSSNNYGPMQFPEKLLPLVIRNVLDNLPIPVYGDGGQQRDWLYVEDHCAGILKALQSAADGSVVNLGTGIQRSNLDVVRQLCRCVARRRGSAADAALALIHHVTDRPGHDRKYAVKTEKAAKELGWTPVTSFSEGIERTVDWYLGNETWLRRKTSGGFKDYYRAVYENAWKKEP